MELKTLGKYELIDQIGSGSMGIIYKARDTMLDRPVALKVLRTEAGVNQEMRERFIREARGCARLHHPGIISIFDLGEVEGKIFIAMELLSGTDLRRQIAERRPLSASAKINIMIQVCDALEHAHRQGVVHRDVKPSNIFLCDDLRIKILDFGFARMPASTLTMAGALIGNPNYMSPEQIAGRSYDHRTDLFSAAIVFAELLRYVHPFASTFIPKRILDSEPDHLLGTSADTPDALQPVLLKGLAKKPEDRYGTAAEFADALRQVLDEAGLTPTGYSRPASSPSVKSDPGLRPATPVRSQPPTTPRPEAPPPVPEERLEIPAGVDPEEWRVQEFFRVLRDFDGALDREGVALAERSLARMRLLEKTDTRFSNAVNDCERRLAELQARLPQPARPTASAPPPTAQPVPVPPPAPRPPAAPPAAIRPDPLKPKVSDDSVLGPALDMNKSVVVGSETDFWNRSLEQVPSPAPPPPEPPPAARPAATPRTEPPTPAGARRGFWPPTRNQIVAILLTAFVAILILQVVRMMRGDDSQPQTPPLAKASVKSANAIIYKESNESSEKIAEVSRGTEIGILDIPTNSAEKWVRVRYDHAGISNKGFALIGDLTGWTSDTPETALFLYINFAPPANAPAADLESHVALLLRGAEKFRGTSAESEIRVRLAEQRLSLARFESGNPKKADELAREGLADLDRATELGATGNRVAELRRDFEAIRKSAAPPAPPAPQQP